MALQTAPDSESDQFKEEQAWWDAYAARMRERGIDLSKFLSVLAASAAQRLKGPPGAQADFAELCAQGCVPEILALIITALRFSPQVQRSWAKIVGGPYKREMAVRVFERASRILDDLFGAFGNNPDVQSTFTAVGRLSPAMLVSELRVYGRTLRLAERISAEMQIRSIKDLCKYTLTAYVKQATGDFHDRNLSSLIAEVLGPTDYSEVAHRMWRSRNYKRLEATSAFVPALLLAVGAVVARSRT
jgi:hypothetical protein